MKKGRKQNKRTLTPRRHSQTDGRLTRLWHDWVAVADALRSGELATDASTLCETFVEDLARELDPTGVGDPWVCKDCLHAAHSATKLPHLFSSLTRQAASLANPPIAKVG